MQIFLSYSPYAYGDSPYAYGGPVSDVASTRQQSLAESRVNQIFLDASVHTQQHQKIGKYWGVVRLF